MEATRPSPSHQEGSRREGCEAGIPGEAPVNRVASRVPFLVTAAIGAAADLLTKTWAFRLLDVPVEKEISPHEPVEIVPGFLQLKASVNAGSLWGLFKEYPTVLLVVTVCIFVVLLGMAFSGWGRGLGMQVALGLFSAGAIGNLADRVVYGRGRDFIDVYVGSKHWPTFNIADSCICVGAVIFLWTEWRAARAARAAPPAGEEGA